METENLGGLGALYDWCSFTVKAGADCFVSAYEGDYGLLYRKTGFEEETSEIFLDSGSGGYRAFEDIAGAPWQDDAYISMCFDVLLEVLGLRGRVEFDCQYGSKGYKNSFRFDGITIMTPSESQDNFWVDMSGTGCRAFETYGSGNWDCLFDFICGNAHLTRLDVACDDYVLYPEDLSEDDERPAGILSMKEMFCDYVFNDAYVSKAKMHKCLSSWEDGPLQGDGSRMRKNEGLTLYCGSEKSEVFLRIYDKAAEMRRSDECHWVRVELQLRDKRALQFIENSAGVGEKFCGVMMNTLRFVEPQKGDKNRWRWPNRPYWDNFLHGAARLEWPKTPGVEYNMQRLSDYIERQCGNSITAYLQVKGVSGLLALAESREHNLPVRYGPVIFDGQMQEKRRLQKSLDMMLYSDDMQVSLSELVDKIRGDVFLSRLFTEDELEVLYDRVERKLSEKIN